MNIIVGIIVGLIALMVLIVAHEFGHFVTARRNGVRVLEFGIGFPPRAIAWIKDPKTGKWRRLRKSEWGDNGITKTVISGEESTKSAEKVQESAQIPAKSAKNVTESAKNAAKSVEIAADERKLAQNGLIFSINWLPIGGFCQMDGESASDKRAGTFGKASFWSKTKILFGGVAMNWLVAWIILTILAWTGMPQFLENQFTIEADTRIDGGVVEVVEIVKDSPAEYAGFLPGDKILAVDGQEVTTAYDVTVLNQEHAGAAVTYTVLREVDCIATPEVEPCPLVGPSEDGSALISSEIELTTTLNPEDAEYLLGVAMESSQTLAYSTWSAPITGAGLTLQLTGETFKGLGQLVWDLISGVGSQFSSDETVRENGQAALSEARDSVSGPVGILGTLFPMFTQAGAPDLFFLIALISISLACMNVLPIPALDGGRWLLIAIYKLRKKELTKETEEKIVSRAMMVLLALIAIITVLDIVRLFR